MASFIETTLCGSGLIPRVALLSKCALRCAPKLCILGVAREGVCDSFAAEVCHPPRDRDGVIYPL
ncbi:hypothetical protein [Roseobacter denitrificans]|uniref:hypothetical protein n=1 Tax=Roseobacter denitrificans TaxID=2434 RepID=UPI0002F03753|nr:hypothetical protein [Roseobacter denitrificans]